jgi:hypothetical protein
LLTFWEILTFSILKAKQFLMGLYYKYQQEQFSSHFTLNLQTVKILEVLAVHPTSAHCHHPKTGSVLGKSGLHISVPVYVRESEKKVWNGQTM